MKEQLIKYLKTRHIKEIDDMWAETKHFFNVRNIEMGGAYASHGTYIRVKYRDNDGEIQEFTAQFDDVVGEPEFTMESIKQLVKDRIDDLFIEAHEKYETSGSDITPEQELEVEIVEDFLTRLLYNQVKQNI